MNRVPLGRDRTFRFLKTHFIDELTVALALPRSSTEVYPQR